MARRASGLPRASPLAVVFILAALLLGVAAALLSGSPPTPPSFVNQPGTSVGYQDLVVFSAIIVAAVVLWVVYRIVQRIRDPSGAQAMNRAVVGFIVAFVLCLGFIALGHVLAQPAPHQGPETAGNNSTVGPHPHPGGSTPGNFSVGPWAVPGWSAYVGVIVIAVVIALIAVPMTLAVRAVPGREAETEAPDAAERARAEIAETLARLEADPDVDPRALIVALYGRLLAAVDRKIDNLEVRTAREVELLSVDELGLPRPAARELTALFEEARYSQHPMTRADSARARAALQRILRELEAGRAP